MQAWIQHIDDYDEGQLTAAFEARSDLLLAGLSVGDAVLVKPNLLQEAAPARALATDPRFVHAVVAFLLSHGLRVIVGDIPGGHVPAARLPADFGLEEYAGDERLTIGHLDRYGFRRVKLEHPLSARPVTLPAVLWQCKAVFNLPKAKTHSLTLVTGAVKNLFGLTPKAERPALHIIASGEEFARCLLDLHDALPVPERIMMDGILGMDGEGPSGGRARRLGAVILADDAVLADWAMCQVMGIRWELTPLSRVSGTPDAALVEGDRAPIRPPFLRPLTYLGGSSVPIAATFQRIVGSANRPVPVVDTGRCIKCGICADHCPAGAITLAPFPRFNRSICVLCYCCQELCPQQAIVLRRTFHR
ncbi:MAG TPA: DUF362 domain-containing protein [Candidatus Cryosericum sp.]|nr:DUF362 domain-containing protein [Candidatus Cryosericum sp.]